MRALCSVTAGVSLLLAMTAVAQSGSSKLGPNIVAQIDRAGAAEVFVMLREPVPLQHHDLRRRRGAIRALRSAVLSSVRSDEVRVHERLSIVSGFTATVTPGGLTTLLANPAVRRIDSMRFGGGALAESVPQIRAAAVHRRDDLGQGVTVAVLDTGVDATHPDLAGSVVAEQCFCSGNCCPDGSSRQAGPGSAFTTFVHGIHVTGIIVSKGIIAPVGVAPMTKVVAVKVLNDQNRGSVLDWIQALIWIAENRADVQAINMSLVSDDVFSGHCDGADAFTMAFAQVLGVLRARGTLTFAAAGNGGQIAAMGAPACVGAAVAVGAVTKADTVASFSNSDAALDLLAPGVTILSTGTNDSTAVLTGTSMAAPHATGAAALLLAINPTLGANQLESALADTGVATFDSRNGLTVPRLDVLAAMNAVLSITAPLLGGGSRGTDCLVEWNVTPETITVWRPIAGAACHDNDPACDADQALGQCTFQLSLCFNVPDRRLPRCSTTSPIVEYRLVTPSAAAPGDALDAANAAAINSALPVLPLVESNHCTASVPLIVPARGSRWIRFSARAADGRRDSDHLRLTCLPRQ